jgi:hypothetical protein
MNFNAMHKLSGNFLVLFCRREPIRNYRTIPPRYKIDIIVQYTIPSSTEYVEEEMNIVKVTMV